MSQVDYEGHAKRPFSVRLQDLWEHPTPFSLFAILKNGLRGTVDTVDGSIAATGPAPSTEEEALHYNLARDRGITGAFDAAQGFSPVTPGFLGRAISRGLTAGPSRAVENRLAGGPTLKSRNSAARYRSERSDQASLPTVASPSISPESPLPRSGGLPGRLRELDKPGDLAPSIGELPVPFETNDPNFRQLKRVKISKEAETAPSDVVTLEVPRRPLSDKDLDIPEFLRRQSSDVIEPAIENAKDPGPEWHNPWLQGGGYFGGGGYGGGGGWGGDRYDPECKQEQEEAREICVDGFERGLRWDGRGWRWISNYATGPHSKKDRSAWLIDDCKRGLISEACGGNAYERPPLSEVKRYLRK